MEHGPAEEEDAQGQRTADGGKPVRPPPERFNERRYLLTVLSVLPACLVDGMAQRATMVRKIRWEGRSPKQTLSRAGSELKLAKMQKLLPAKK